MGANPGDPHRRQPGVERTENVALPAVADHHRRLRLGADLAERKGEDVGVRLADPHLARDDDGPERRRESRAVELEPLDVSRPVGEQCEPAAAAEELDKFRGSPDERVPAALGGDVGVGQDGGERRVADAELGERGAPGLLSVDGRPVSDFVEDRGAAFEGRRQALRRGDAEAVAERIVGSGAPDLPGGGEHDRDDLGGVPALQQLSGPPRRSRIRPRPPARRDPRVRWFPLSSGKTVPGRERRPQRIGVSAARCDAGGGAGSRLRRTRQCPADGAGERTCSPTVGS